MNQLPDIKRQVPEPATPQKPLPSIFSPIGTDLPRALDLAVLAVGFVVVMAIVAGAVYITATGTLSIVAAAAVGAYFALRGRLN